MNDANLIMTKGKEPEETHEGISEDQIAKLHEERKRKEAKKKKRMGCWDCGKKLTTWDFPVGASDVASMLDEEDLDGRRLHIKDVVLSVVRDLKSSKFEIPDGFKQSLGEALMKYFFPIRLTQVATSPALKLAKKKVAGLGYLCFLCYKEASESTGEVGPCFFCGQEEGVVARTCGVPICDRCMAPKTELTDITSHGDGYMSEEKEIVLVRDWWFAGRGLLSCLMELEMFQRTENVKRLKQLRTEITEEQKLGLITEGDLSAIMEGIDLVIAEVAKDDGDPVELAAGLYGTIEGLMMKALYHLHPLKQADIQLEPGTYQLEGERPDGLDTFEWTVKDAPVILKRIEKTETDNTAEKEDEEPAKDD